VGQNLALRNIWKIKSLLLLIFGWNFILNPELKLKTRHPHFHSIPHFYCSLEVNPLTFLLNFCFLLTFGRIFDKQVAVWVLNKKLNISTIIIIDIVGTLRWAFTKHNWNFIWNCFLIYRRACFQHANHIVVFLLLVFVSLPTFKNLKLNFTVHNMK
jgi:hypothetical protein